MNVLSLFDGMSCGQIALARLGIKVSKYFASEIKPHAIKVTKRNFPNTIHIGDVTNVSYKSGILYTENGNIEVENIDLLIGGSPCQDLSGMNRKKVGLKGYKSSLFWHYHRILNEINPKHFLLENVGSAPKSDIQTITKSLGVDGVRINSSLVSAQMRDRIYWTNIPGTGIDLFGKSYIEQPKDKQIFFKDIVESGFVFTNKKGALLARDYMSYSHKDMHKLAEYLVRRKRFIGESAFPIVFINNEYDYREDNIRMLSQTELEELQTVTKGYTSCLSYNQAFNVIGDGWTVDVICHIFQGLKQK